MATVIPLDEESVPVYHDTTSLSQGSTVNRERYNELIKKFTETYGHKPKYISRAPGRVNLIGEHIDYCGYGVLPMAIEQDIAMAFTLNDTNNIIISNTQSSRYPSQTINIDSYEIQSVSWYNYFLCGFKGIIEHYNITKPRGMNILVDGTIPPSSGLSSSSALVCCASLVTIIANNINNITKKQLADICAQSERYIGTQGGGMDQAVSFLAEVGKAIKIDFNPLVCTPLSLPDGYSFVIANSGISMNKAATLSFNERVVECRLATKIIATLKGLKWDEIDKFLQLQQTLGCMLKDMPSIVKECLHQQVYSKDEICKLLNIIDIEEAISTMSPQAKEAAKRLDTFHLYQRAMHVFQEAQRVIFFQETATSCTEETAGIKLGQLMNDSHTSCSSMYDCSCPELDNLVKICLNEGALGSRLTGAGWGGCTVSIVTDTQLEHFITGVCSKYYNQKMEVNQLFATRPGPGAAVCQLNQS